jgi:hypothetical protein
MSSTPHTTFTSSTFEALLNAALTEYTKQTGIGLWDHPLTSKISGCDNPDSVLRVFQEQAQAFDKFREGDTRLFKWLRPVVTMLNNISIETRIASAILVSPETFRCYSFRGLELSIPKAFPRTNSVFSGILILLSVRISLIISAPPLVTFRIAR